MHSRRKLEFALKVSKRLHNALKVNLSVRRYFEQMLTFIHTQNWVFEFWEFAHENFPENNLNFIHNPYCIFISGMKKSKSQTTVHGVSALEKCFVMDMDQRYQVYRLCISLRWHHSSLWWDFSFFFQKLMFFNVFDRQMVIWCFWGGQNSWMSP